MAKYPSAIQRPSSIPHPQRSETRGIVIHNTYGSEAGDLATLDGPSVDAHFLVTKRGVVYQFLDTNSASWTAYHTANHTCIHIELEGKREVSLTVDQYTSLLSLVRWLCELEHIPVRKTDPISASNVVSWTGLFDHRDLAGIDGNNHSDGLPPSYPGWGRFIGDLKDTPKPKISALQRLIRAGFGPKSAAAIVRKFNLDKGA